MLLAAAVGFALQNFAPLLELPLFVVVVIAIVGTIANAIRHLVSAVRHNRRWREAEPLLPQEGLGGFMAGLDRHPLLAALAVGVISILVAIVMTDFGRHR